MRRGKTKGNKIADQQKDTAGKENPKSPPTPEAWERLLTAIVEDDRPGVLILLQGSPGVVTQQVLQARLYDQKIRHWLYAGDTALHLAAAGHRVELVRQLLAAGADPNARGNHRASGPVHYAADGQPNAPEWNEQQQVKTIQGLVAAGANRLAQDKNGATPLHRAVRTRCAAAVNCLLAAGGAGKMENKSGATPFHLAVQDTGRGGSGTAAAREAQRRIIREFLRCGLTPSLKGRTGKSVRASVRSRWIMELLDEGTNPADPAGA